MTLQEMIDVLEASKDGMQIQARGKPGEGDEEWHDVFPNWDFYHCDFRIKPEPREWWVHVHPDGSASAAINHIQRGVKNPQDQAYYNVRVREVL